MAITALSAKVFQRHKLSLFYLTFQPYNSLKIQLLTQCQNCYNLPAAYLVMEELYKANSWSDGNKPAPNMRQEIYVARHKDDAILDEEILTLQ